MKLTRIAPPTPIVIPMEPGWEGLIRARIDGPWAILEFDSVRPLEDKAGTQLIANLPAGMTTLKRPTTTLTAQSSMSQNALARVLNMQIHISATTLPTSRWWIGEMAYRID